MYGGAVLHLFNFYYWSKIYHIYINKHVFICIISFHLYLLLFSTISIFLCFFEIPLLSFTVFVMCMFIIGMFTYTLCFLIWMNKQSYLATEFWKTTKSSLYTAIFAWTCWCWDGPHSKHSYHVVDPAVLDCWNHQKIALTFHIDASALLRRLLVSKQGCPSRLCWTMLYRQNILEVSSGIQQKIPLTVNK